MKFDPEVFISYSHLDDEPFIPGRRWVTEFHRALLVRVRQKLGDKEFEIFRDPELQGNDDFSERLCNVLHRTGVLVPVVSPGYVNSEWTRRELAEFLDAASKSGGVKIGDRARLFQGVKPPVPDDEQPPELDPFLGYEFFDRRANRAYEFDADDKACWAKVDDMAC